jgi:KDO2-lipid IV(A) lauroyltransferase
MRRPTSRAQRIGYFLQAIPVFLLFGLMRAIPVWIASPLGGALGRLIGPVLPVSRKARRNLAVVLADHDSRARARILRQMWDNLGRNIAESAHVEKLWDTGMHAAGARYGIVNLLEAAEKGTPVTLKAGRIELAGAQNFIRVLTGEGPAILFTAHMGNWELLPLGAAQFGVYTSVVFRTPNNPYVARLLERLREGMVTLLPKGYEGAVLAGRVMEQGGRLGLLIDQKQNRGVPIPFFGIDAMTGTTLAKLALRYNCPVYGTYVQRLGGRRFRITMTDPLRIEPTGDDRADERAIMTAVNAEVERWIRDDPGQWLWLHRRWPKEAV